MSNLHVKYLLIGGGLASSSAAAAIRERDREGSVLLVGQEIIRPYHRPPLSKQYLRHEIPREELFTLPAGWFAEQQVQLRTGQRATHVDTPRRMVTFDSGEEVVFDRLLLATGAAPRLLEIQGANLPNLFYLRTLEDADRLEHAIDKARAEGRPHLRGRGRAVVIGGGLLGVELCATLTQKGLSVDLVAGAPWPWRKFAGETTGRFLARYLEEQGVRVHLNHRADRLEGDGRVQRVVLSSAEMVEADFAVAAVGITINRELLRGTPINAGRAILTDDHCSTNVKGIYAAGDCAAVFDPLFGKHRLLDHWDSAVVTGRLAGLNMAGGNERYEAVNHFASEIFGLPMSVWGERRLVDRRLLRGTPGVESPNFIEFGIASDGRIAQVVAIGHRRDDELLADLVRRRVRIDGNEELLRDPGSDLCRL